MTSIGRFLQAPFLQQIRVVVAALLIPVSAVMIAGGFPFTGAAGVAVAAAAVFLKSSSPAHVKFGVGFGILLLASISMQQEGRSAHRSPAAVRYIEVATTASTQSWLVTASSLARRSPVKVCTTSGATR
ncbi:hypothetical protein [Xanthomonas citri]|uniref:hypothetical protein n=1 Tax=Xanthomonas citri TaxID=346 RepID=UPI000CCDABB4|nr:hypothetical protein [Xanthomonas citri]PNV26823.1 hypothetical protein xavtCFBP7764_21710 [Xanthomonas citri]